MRVLSAAWLIRCLGNLPSVSVSIMRTVSLSEVFSSLPFSLIFSHIPATLFRIFSFRRMCTSRFFCVGVPIASCSWQRVPSRICASPHSWLWKRAHHSHRKPAMTCRLNSRRSDRVYPHAARTESATAQSFYQSERRRVTICNCSFAKR